MKAYKKLVLEKLVTKESVIISTRTIIHLCLDVSKIKDVTDIPISVCNKK